MNAPGHKTQVDSSINFIKEHHFKDTFALLVVFLSFNHLASLCLLAIFIITTKSRNFLATCFIRLFLSKQRCGDVEERPTTVANKAKSATVDTSASGSGKDVGPDAQRYTDGSTSAFIKRKCALFKISPFFLLELVVAGLLRVHASQYFTRPIENLAMSIIASSLINDPRDCLSYATSCSILYGLVVNVWHRAALFLDLKISPVSVVSASSLHQWYGSLLTLPILGRAMPLFWRLAGHSSKYLRICRYLASFHIVLAQFYQNMTDPHYFQKNVKRSTVSDAPASVSMTQNNSQAGPYHLNMALPNGSGINATHSNGPPLLSVPNPIAQKASFSGVVSEYDISELPMNSPSESNQQTITTNVTTSNLASTPDEASYTNQFFTIKMALDREKPSETHLDDYFITTSNLENFIQQLFKWKNHHLIPPLWSIFTTIKTMTLEKRNVRSFDGASSTSDTDTSDTSETIRPTNSNPLIKGSVFTGPDASDCMTLIAPAADDYNQLHLVPHNLATDYKVCISDTGPTQITFRITNLFEGELIVLVNGVIWSQVLSAITSEKIGEEYTVVSGLVPSCSYDIQFVNRFNEGKDFLIADLMVRTCAKAGENKEPLDFSFPSYYHRKFLSPLLTLKHSVLTTNTNLAEERAKVKKTKKEISKKLSSLRQESDHLKFKIAQNASQDEKSAFKMDNLKTVLQQSESQLSVMEDRLKEVLAQEVQVEQEHLQQKDKHLQTQMEHGKLQATLAKEKEELSTKLAKLEQELSQLRGKRERMNLKQEKLKKEVTQFAEGIENFRLHFLSQRQTERQRREELRNVEANESELAIRGLEQDISRLEGENEAMKNMLRAY
ncbi:LAME_0E07030g1_1 [Lachancea meyersii CBS 8951]|uniref:LAME_0E07030g1_1 n=1 Tax=Lachancea meyersii CBS 8951 TaxID=1266667 RepID=A0A1G4JI53_9SACH|nr:LAME_0E07030g1_1 [Lachancea meyersii CBS 8951]